MSNLSVSLEALARARLDDVSARSQLSVTTYFSDDLFRREMELIFQHGPRYLGHELSVPEVGDFYALPQEGEGRALVRTPQGVELVSNVCRHRQALMLRGRGQVRGGAGPGRRPRARAHLDDCVGGGRGAGGGRETAADVGGGHWCGGWVEWIGEFVPGRAPAWQEENNEPVKLVPSSMVTSFVRAARLFPSTLAAILLA